MAGEPFVPGCGFRRRRGGLVTAANFSAPKKDGGFRQKAATTLQALDRC